MQDHELAGLLGPAYDEVTDEQREQVREAADAIDARWPDPDDSDARQDALASALAVILGDDTLEGVGVRYVAARRAAEAARAGLIGALIVSEGAERDLAGRAGVARMTVRKARGK